MDAGLVAGFDLGGTKLTGELADLSGHVLAQATAATHHPAPLAQISAMLGQLIEQAGQQSQAVRHVAVGVPGAVSQTTGLVSFSPNLGLPSDQPLADLLADLCVCPVTVENDVNAAAWGEFIFGHGRKHHSLAFLSFGTGVGLGLVLNGALWRGGRGMAGEIALLPLGDSAHAQAPQSRNGLFEDAVGSPGIRQRYGDDTVSVTEIFARAAAGEGKAIACLHETARLASYGVASLISLLDPPILVLGGGIGTQPDFVQALLGYTAPLLGGTVPEIMVSAFGPAAGGRGATALALATIGQKP